MLLWVYSGNVAAATAVGARRRVLRHSIIVLAVLLCTAATMLLGHRLVAGLPAAGHHEMRVTKHLPATSRITRHAIVTGPERALSINSALSGLPLTRGWHNLQATKRTDEVTELRADVVPQLRATSSQAFRPEPIDPTLRVMQRTKLKHQLQSATAELEATLPKPKVYSMNPSLFIGKARVLYGIATCSAAGFPAIVDAVFETWAQKLPREQLVIAGGLRDDAVDGLAKERTPCGDKAHDFWCKEAVLLWRAAKRAEALDAKWVCVSQEDKYIWTDAVDAELGKHDASQPVVFATWGCAQHWTHHVQSKGNTLPKPKSWRKVEHDFCDSVNRLGSMCGGPTYFVSRGMLQGLVKGSHTLLDFLTLFRTASTAKANSGASDVISSCFFYDRLPHGKWRKTEANRPWIGTPENNRVTRASVDAHRFTKDGVADVSVFVTSWKKDHPKARSPLTMHLNHILKKQAIPGYMRELHVALPAE